MPAAHQQLIEAVQTNCHISDARHAGSYTLCTYLMKMRELFRWEQGLGFDEDLDRDALGEWVKKREHDWENIEDHDYAAIEINGNRYDPFDQDAINTALADDDLIYSGGFGVNSVAHFFLAHVHERRQMGGDRILIAGKELARDLTAPPAMTRDGTVFLRREALRRLLWERVQEWRWNEADNAMGKALAFYELEENLNAGLNQLTEDQIEVILWHETGELAAGEILSEEWEKLLQSVSGLPAEIRLRAVRDNLADALSTLKKILQRGQPHYLHFYFGMLTPLRKKLQPGLIKAYQHWSETNSSSELEAIVLESEKHWETVATECLKLYQNEEDYEQKISRLIDGKDL